MKTCEIQWIDDNGKPTPDTNPAIGIARSIITYGGGDSQVREYPICAEHAAQIPTEISTCAHYVSRWDLLPLPTE